MKRMHTVQVETRIDAPLDRCFDLARSVDAHVASAEGTGERAVAGRRSGLLVLGEEVTWEARHLGIRQRLTSRITAFERPTFFRIAWSGALSRNSNTVTCFNRRPAAGHGWWMCCGFGRPLDCSGVAWGAGFWRLICGAF